MAINPSNGCTVTTTMAVTTNTTLPVITSSSATGTITCTSSSSTLTGISAGNTLTWNGGALANATNPSTVNASGTYTLTATNPSNGCVTNTTVSVNSNITLPTLTAGSPATISCITNTTQVTGSSLTAGVTYSWSGAGITAGATTSSATVNAAGVYSLTVTSSSTGCSNTTTVLVSASPSPTASVSSDVTIFSGASTTLTAGGGGTYVWNNGPTTSSQVVSPKETTNYCVTVTDGAGCTNQKCVLVTVELSCYTNDEYETPTAFTPNNDGMNDQFSLQGWDECTTSFFITIYDRWGEKIFESEDVNFNWDGSYKGKALGSAVFVYYIKADILKVGTINKKGNITLIR
jgi:gliding motility-associated-like protein